MRLIDGDDFANHLGRMAKLAYPNLLPGLLEAMDYAKEFPAVDAVEVVRCKDCKSWNREDESGGMCTVDVAPVDTEIDGVWRLPCDFCSCGERRSDNAAD